VENTCCLVIRYKYGLYFYGCIIISPVRPFPFPLPIPGEHLTGEFRDNVNRFRKLPAITDHGYQLSENVAIFRHLAREKLVPEHWYPRRHLGRSRIDEYLAWQQTNMGVATTEYFQQKWLVPYLQKTRPADNAVGDPYPFL